MKDHFHQELDAYQISVENYSIFALTMLRDSFDAFRSLNREQACEIAGGMESHCISCDTSNGQPEMHQQIMVPRKIFLSLKSDQLEEEGLMLIGLNQPVARDLRTISCCMNLITSAERIGRYGKDICHCTYKLPDGIHIKDMMGLPEMAALSISMLEDAITAFRTHDLGMIRGFSERDDCVDRMRYNIYEDCIMIMKEDPKTIPYCATYLLIDRYLERCADHACKTAEKIHYMVTGERVDIR